MIKKIQIKQFALKQEIKSLFLLIGFIIILFLIIFRQYIFDGHFFFSQGILSDLLRANIPAYYQLYDCLEEGGYLWSWNMGIGTSMYTHADGYFDPFTYILFLFGRKYIPHMMIVLFGVKILCEGLVFFTYLKYFKIDQRACVAGAILYAFSGYSIIMGSNFAVGTILVYAPIILLGIEKWMDSKKVWILLIGLFLTCIYSIYFFYIAGILTAIYLAFRLYQKKVNPLPKLFVLIVIGIIVIMLSGISLIPQLQLMLSSNRVSGISDVPTDLRQWMPQLSVWITALIRSISGDILGSQTVSSYLGFSYFGEHDYFQISTFSSALIVILLVQYWHNERKQRNYIILTMIILSAITLLPFFSYFLNACATINARWMFAITIVECLMAALSIDSIIRSNGLDGRSLYIGIILSFVVIISGIVLLAIISGDFSTQIINYYQVSRKHILVLMMLYFLMGLIYFIQRKYAFIKHRHKKYTIYALIAVILIIDEGVTYYHWYGNGQTYCSYSEKDQSSYNDTSAKVIKKIQSEDSGFYRLNKDFDSVKDNNGIVSNNDAMVQGYYGLKNYNSMNNANYVAFLQELGIYVCTPLSKDIQYYTEHNISPKELHGQVLNYINGVGDRYELMGYLGVKYFLTKERNPDLPQYYQYIYSENNVKTYENRYFLPLAFVNIKEMSLEEFSALSEKEKDYALYQYTIVEDITTNKSKIQKDENVLTQSAIEKQNAFNLIKFSEDKISFKIDVPENAHYLSFSMPYDTDWQVFVDGEHAETCKINIALLGAKISSGEHEVELVYKPKTVQIGAILSIVTFLILILLNRKVGRIFFIIEEHFIGIICKVWIFIANKFFQKKVLNLFIKIACVIVSVLIALGSSYIIRPATFVKQTEIETINRPEDLYSEGWEINGNEFTAIQDDANILIPVNKKFSNIRVSFNGIKDIDNKKNIPVTLTYTNEVDGVANVQSHTQYVSKGRLDLVFEYEGDSNYQLSLQVGNNAGISFDLNKISFYQENLFLSLTDYLQVALLSLLILVFINIGWNKCNRKKENLSVRDSNIELCRIVCMLMVIGYNYALYGGAETMTDMCGNRILALLLVPGGKICFDAFLAMSCWYLVDQSFHTKHFLKIWLTTCFYSILFTIVAYLLGKPVTFKEGLSVILPITGNSHWFAAVYLAFYLLVPFLNKLVKNLSKNQIQWLLILLFYFEIGSRLIGCFNGYSQPLVSELLLFSLCYFIAFYLKKWPFQFLKNQKVLLGIVIFIWVSLWTIRYHYMAIPGHPAFTYIITTMCEEYSVTSLLGGFSIFFFFKNIKVRNIPFINYLAMSTFGVLLIHDHNIFRTVLWENLLKTYKWYYSDMFGLNIIIIIITIFSMGIIIDQLRIFWVHKKILRNKKVQNICRLADTIVNK